MTALLDRLARDGAAVDLGPEPDEATAATADVVAALRRALAALPDERAVLVAWDDAGALHRPETLDAALAELAGLGPLAFLRGGVRRKLLRAARIALRGTSHAGSIRLAAAFVGELGGERDIDALETVARHPALTLHGVTALSNLRTWHARMAMLRLLVTTGGAQRVLVIDRLLPHAGTAAVRLALVRDALTGLAPEHARDVAPSIAEICRCRELADDTSVETVIRDAARAVLAAASPE